MVLGNLIGGFITVLIGVTLMPTIGNSVYDARFTTNSSGGNLTVESTNVTGASSAIIGLTTLFFSLGVMAAGVALAVNGLKNAGMF